MASATLFAPTIATYTPAFVADDTLRIYFEPSAYNTTSFNYVQLTIKYNTDSVNALKRDVLYQKTGIRLNIPYTYDIDTQQYYIEVPQTWIGVNTTSKVEGWSIGQVYKIQIRLDGTKGYGGMDSKGQWIDYDPFNPPSNSTQENEAKWITQNSDYFSEWSTVCITKAIGKCHVRADMIEFDSDNEDGHYRRTSYYYFRNDELDFQATYTNDDPSEVLYKYQLQLYDVEDTLIEDSGYIYKDKFDNISTFGYRFRKDLEINKIYYIKINIETINGYTTSYKSYFASKPLRLEENSLQILFLDNLAFKHLPDALTEYADGTEPIQQKYSGETPDHRTVTKYLTTITEENENGWIAYKLYSDDGGKEWDGQIIVKRTDEDTNFEMYDDINVIPLYNTEINSLPVFYDLTAQSGKSYKYAVQYVNRRGSRSPKLDKTLDIRRNYEFSYLLGNEDLQLKLNFNTQLDSYVLHRSDNIFDTLGGKYPIITRNGNLGYKSFNLSGLISFNQDDCEMFLPRKEMYGYSKRERRDNRYDYDPETYIYYTLDEELPVYMDDFHYENMFREKVLQFLNDGKVKLFKSATELNMIVRITDVSLTPESSLNRLIYNFQCTCTEVAECTIENLRKYDLLNYYEEKATTKNDYSTGYGVGQLITTVTDTTNLLRLIQNNLQLDTTIPSQQLKIITNIHDLKVNITSQPRIGSTDSASIAGWQMNFVTPEQSQNILISQYNPTYSFDNSINIPMVDSTDTPLDFQDTPGTNGIFIRTKDESSGTAEIDKTPTDVELNFVYSYLTQTNEDTGKEIESREVVNRFVQENIVMGAQNDLMQTLRRYYYFESDTNFQYLYYIDAFQLETYPNSIFNITSLNENEEPHTQDVIVGPTGMLILDDYNMRKVTSIKYVGIMKYKDEETKAEYEIDTSSTIPVHFDCYCSVYKGTYKVEEKVEV